MKLLDHPATHWSAIHSQECWRADHGRPQKRPIASPKTIAVNEAGHRLVTERRWDIGHRGCARGPL